MKRIKKLFAAIAIAFLLVPVSVMVLPTSGDYAHGACWQCVPDNGAMVCENGFAIGWETCIQQQTGECWETDGRCSIFE